MFFRIAVSFAFAIGGASAPVLAQTQQSVPAAKAPDPNEKICQDQTVIGSRLAKHRICATRAEWEERNRQDRQTVEQAQRMIGGPCTTVGNKNTGAPAC